MDYKDRLKIFKLDSLEYRRTVFDLALVYKILNGLIYVDPDDFFYKEKFYQTYNLRRHSQCLTSSKISKHNIRNSFFSIIILRVWNNLPSDIARSESLKIFKHRLNEIDLHD